MDAVVVGAGGHAKVVIEALQAAHPAIHLVIVDDDSSKLGKYLLGSEIVGTRAWLEADSSGATIALAIGDNRLRFNTAAWVRALGRQLLTIIHPASILSPSALIEDGAFLGPACVVNAQAAIGAGAIVNTAASVDHDCQIGQAAHIAPGARLCGNVNIGDRTLVGAGAVIAPGVRVGSDVVIGAGSTVIRDIADGAVVVGTPARPL